MVSGDLLWIDVLFSKFASLISVVVILGLTTMATASPGGKFKCGTYSLRIVDEARSLDLRPFASDLSGISDNNFRAFVSTVSTHVLTAACVGGSLADVQLLFVSQPLVKQGMGAASNLVDKQGGPEFRLLNSPWVKLGIGGQPVLRIDAVFVWNERQILRDQAEMAGGAAPGEGPPSPIAGTTLARYSSDYAKALQDGKAGAGLEDRIPREILWLYQHAVQSTFADFSVFARAALDATLARARASYAEIVDMLFDRCLQSATGTSEHYTDILQIKSVVGLGTYRIDVLR